MADEVEVGVGVDGFGDFLDGEKADPVDAGEEACFDVECGGPGVVAGFGDEDVVAAGGEHFGHFGARRLEVAADFY